MCSFGHLQFRCVFNGGAKRAREVCVCWGGGVNSRAVSLVFMAQLKIAALKQAIISLSLSPFCLPHCCCIKCLPSLPYLCSPLCISTPSNSPFSRPPLPLSSFLYTAISPTLSVRFSLMGAIEKIICCCCIYSTGGS